MNGLGLVCGLGYGLDRLDEEDGTATCDHVSAPRSLLITPDERRRLSG